jgi:hypothetical protein
MAQVPKTLAAPIGRQLLPLRILEAVDLQMPNSRAMAAPLSAARMRSHQLGRQAALRTLGRRDGGTAPGVRNLPSSRTAARSGGC